MPGRLQTSDDEPSREDASDDVMTVDEAARYLRIGRNQLYEAVGRGDLPHLRIGRTIRLPRRARDRVLGRPA